MTAGFALPLPDAEADKASPPAGVKRSYKRILLKLSGEIFAGSGASPMDMSVFPRIAAQIKEVNDAGVQVGVVVGGGNILRGKSPEAEELEPVCADQIGMLGTVMNALALQGVLERQGVRTRVQSAVHILEMAEPFIRRRAIRHMEKGRVVIFAAGTGSPYFTTDTAAALRANEIEAEVILKATKVDGVYDGDPAVDAGAKRYDRITHLDVLSKGLRVMDATAISLCMDNQLPIVVFNVNVVGNLVRAALGEPVGTRVEGAGRSG